MRAEEIKNRDGVVFGPADMIEQPFQSSRIGNNTCQRIRPAKIVTGISGNRTRRHAWKRSAGPIQQRILHGYAGRDELAQHELAIRTNTGDVALVVKMIGRNEEIVDLKLGYVLGLRRDGGLYARIVECGPRIWHRVGRDCRDIWAAGSV